MVNEKSKLLMKQKLVERIHLHQQVNDIKACMLANEKRVGIHELIALLDWPWKNI